MTEQNLYFVVPSGFVLLLIVIVVGYVSLKGRIIRTEATVSEHGARIGRNEERVSERLRALEDAILRIPSKEDFDKLDARLDHFDRAQAAQTEQLRMALAGIDRLHGYMMHKGASGV